MGKRRSRSRAADVEEDAVAVTKSTKAPAKKRVARTQKAKEAADGGGEEAVAHIQPQQQSDAVEEHTVTMDDDNKADQKEEPRVRKLAPSKRQPPPLPHSSPLVLRTPLTSRLFPQSAAAIASGMSAGGEDDSIIKRLNFGLKEAPTPGRSESIARQKQGQPLLVYCRIRPLSEDEQAVAQAEGRDSEAQCVQADGATGVNCTAPKDSHCFSSGESSAKFHFSGVFGPGALQSEVFARSTQPLLDDSIARGQNTLVFAYGLTKSGKTYTMFGKDGEEQGIIPRAVHTVFDRVSGEAAADGAFAATTADSTLNSPTYLLSPASRPVNPAVLVSFLEIYNDKLRDLLTKERGDKAGRCELQNCSADGTENGEVYVKGLREVEVRSRQEAFALLKQGQKLRQKAKTELNSDSSRSHAVFTLKLLDEAGHVWCRLSIVDLAGSERTNRTKTQAGDERRKEASNINQSLVVLGRCLEALRNNNKNKKQQLVPYRDSTLTRLFKDSLSGWGRTIMIVNVSQVHADYDETVLALKYASIAKEVTIVAKVDAQLDVRELKRKHRLKQLQDAANKKLEEEEEDEVDDDEDDGQDSDSSAEDELLAVDDEQLPVTIHQSSKRDDREEECFELTEAVYILKQENVALRAEKAQQEQQLREQYTAEMEKQVEEAELRAKRTVEDEKQRTTKLMEAKFRLREEHMEEAATELEDRLAQLEADIAQQTEAASKQTAEKAASLLKSEEARQRLHQQMQEAEAQRQLDVQTERQQKQQLTEQLHAAQAEAQAVQDELQAAKHAGGVERTALLVKLAAAEAEVAALKVMLATEQAATEAALQQVAAERAAAAAEQTERAARDKKDRKERDDRDKQREKEVSKERSEWEKAKKVAEKERVKREKDAEAMQAEMDDKMQQLQAELEAAVAAHEDSTKRWRQHEGEYKQQVSKAMAEAREQHSAYQQQTEALVKEKEAQMAASLAWTEGEHEKQTAGLRAEIEKCNRRIEELEEQKRDIERKRQAEAAMRVKEEATRQELEQKTEQERVAHQEHLLLLAQVEAVRAEYNQKEDRTLAMPAFVALIRSLLHSKPTANSAPSTLPESIVAQPVKVVAAPAATPPAVADQLPVIAAPAPATIPAPAPAVTAPPAVPAPAIAILPPVPPAKPTRPRKGSKVNKRDSMDDFYDGYDEKLVSAAIAHASLDGNTSGVTSGLAAFAKKAKARLSSATDSLRFNSSRTAPASSLHHALNESKAAALIASAAAATVESTTSAAAVNNRVLLSPQVQRALKASSRRSRSKSRKGKENEEATDPYDFERAVAADGAGEKESSKVRKASKKKRREQELLAAALNKGNTAAPLSESAHFDRVVMGENSTAVPPVVKYGRQESISSISNVAPEPPLKPKMPQAAPTPVAKRTRQHTGSK